MCRQITIKRRHKASTMTMILSNARLATMVTTGTGPGAGYGFIEAGAVLIRAGRIAYAGPEADLPETPGVTRYDMGGRLVTPALVDCHTHLIFGGERAQEFEMRLNGASYEEVARAGGGIISTVRATRAASEDELLEQALLRVDQMIAGGVGTIEVKSGYGLDIETELRMLRAARRIGEHRRINVLTTFLGAHAIPPDYKDRADAYLDEQVLPALKAAHAEGLVDAVDGFCEGIAFSPAQIERVFKAALALGLPVKLHAEQLSNLHGAALAAQYGALSADHLEYLDAVDAGTMARAGTVAVILPGAFYTLRETKLPPIEALRGTGAEMAVATDCNPGTAPMTSLLLAMNMA
ncbi:imidazolonepropionase, partial [Thioclava sp. BHET1]